MRSFQSEERPRHAAARYFDALDSPASLASCSAAAAAFLSVKLFHDNKLDRLGPQASIGIGHAFYRLQPQSFVFFLKVQAKHVEVRINAFGAQHISDRKSVV